MALDVSIPPVRRSREWLTGMRPVAGAVGACSLMLLACSWFAFRPGSLDAGRDVGSPAPVRIDDGNPEAAHSTHSQALQASTRHRGSITPRRSSPAAVTRDIRASTSRPQHSPLPAVPAEAAPPSPAPPSPAAPPAATPPAEGLPTVSVPPVTHPPMSLPQVSEVPGVQLPDLATTTPPLGLP